MREVRRAREAAKDREARRDAYEEPHYYVLYYPPGRGPGSGWERPKLYEGPFAARAKADEELRALKKRSPRGGTFRIRRLTAVEFESVWGAPPQPRYRRA